MAENMMRASAMNKNKHILDKAWSYVLANNILHTEGMYQALIRHYTDSRQWQQALRTFDVLMTASPEDIEPNSRQKTFVML